MTKPLPGKKLSTRLFVALFLTAILVLLAVTGAVVAVSWTIYEHGAEETLVDQTRASAADLAGLDEGQMVAHLSSTALANTRITLVAADGRVIFDSDYEASTMPSHAARAEIAAARSEGTAVMLRASETAGSDTLYAATLVDGSDDILRLSTTRSSFAYYLGNLLPALFAIMALAVIASLVVARVITGKITTPIVSIDPEQPLESETYVEVEPLLARIEEQKLKLVEQNRQLERAVTLRREFTGNVSHEMKSPLQVIGGYAELIESGIADGEDARKFAGLICAESQAMRRLIDDVLTLSRLDESASGRTSLFDLVATAKVVLVRLAPMAAERDVRLFLAGPDVAWVLGIETLAEQVVYNLVDNAIRHGRAAGRVELDIRCSAQDVVLDICDDGDGISPEAQQRVFERFYRVDPSRSRETGGTGLGLAIVKHGVESMGGSVTVGQSALGGARFTVRLPAANGV